MDSPCLRKRILQQIAKLVKKDYSVLLNVGLAHLKYFKNLQSNYREKTAIFSSCLAFQNKDFTTLILVAQPKQKRI